MKKHFKRLLSWLLMACMIISTVISSSPITTKAKEVKNGEKDILWSTSFETPDDFTPNKLDEKGSANVAGVLSGTLTGDITYLVDIKSVEGSTDFNENETKVKLFDRSSSTKFLTNTGLPVTVTWSLKDKMEKAINQYGVVAANDAPERDPKSWKLYGKKESDADWSLIDEQSNQVFTARYQKKLYSISEPEDYSSYKLVISEKNGSSGSMTQLADIILATGKKEDNEFQSDGMNVEITNGPTAAWNQKSNAGWSGSKALRTSGSITGNDAYSYNILYDNLNIPVDSTTYLKYNIFPSMSNGDVYDFQYTGMFMSIDLKFEDGTYLSEYDVYDQNENPLNAAGQGASRTLTTHQWNQIYSNIGTIARGKVIKSVLVDYNKPAHDMAGLIDFITYFDDIEIYNKSETVHNHLSEYTSILRGTNDSSSFSRGLTAPAVTMPHGFNFFVPATNLNDNKIYDYQDTSLRYITISHEPSYWIGDRGTWQFMVNTSINASTANSFGLGSLTSDFAHEKESAHAHYYSVEFDKEKGASKGSKLELTPTNHGAVVRFTFDKDTANRNVILDCTRAAGGVTFNNEGAVTTFTSYSDHMSNGSKRMYVYGVFNKKANITKTSNKAGLAGFNDEVVEMKIATSYISYDQAKKNLELEIASEENFDDIYNKAQGVWDKKLNIINDVKGATYEQLVTLYSNMYRLFAYPNTMSENVGTNDNPVWKYKSPYRAGDAEPVDGEIYINNGFWDTYRTTWAAYGLFTPAEATRMLNGLVQHYKDQGWVPRWIAPGGTNSMVGTSSDVIFADALMKDIEFDYENAYKSAIRNAATVSSNLTNGGRTKLETSIFLGYTPGTGDEFSWSMEGYVNDYGIAQMAKALAEKETDETKKEQYYSEYQYYINRAKNYVKLFDDSGETVLEKWFKGKSSSGEWNISNYTDDKFDPFYWGANYTETNAYNMAVSVPQDGQGLANLYGGLEELGKKLDSIFTTNGIYNGYGAVNSVGGIHEQKEAREVKLGQYGHSNQPSHHIPYMYNYAGQPWKTQEYVRDVLDRCYVGSTFGQGYIGDEDNGEMSAWYIFSALGFYPLAMGSDEYAIGSPLFDEVTVNLEEGKTLKIIANNNSKENVYIQSMKLNGVDYSKNHIKHSDIATGGTIEFNMGDTPNTSWGSSENDLPTSLTAANETVKSYDDIIQPKANIVNADTIPEGKVYKDCVSSMTADVAKLIDNTSATEAKLENDATIYYSLDSEKKAEMFTITSGKEEPAPTSVALYGALSDGVWVELGNYNNLSFEWSRYTRPFKIKEELQKEYSHYKFVFSEGSVSEIELLSYDDGIRTREDLGNLIASAKLIDQSNMISVIKMKLNEAIEAAEVVYHTGTTEEEFTSAYNALKKVIDDVTSEFVNPYEPIEAENFTNGNVLIDYVNGVPHNIGGVKANYWASYENVLFDGGSNFIEMHYSAQGTDGGGYVEIHLDSKDSEPVGIIETPVTAPSGWATYKTVSATLPATISGLHDIYLVFRNDGSHAYVANVDWFKFTKTSYNNAEINPVSVTFDIINPTDVTTSILWNDATLVEDILMDGMSIGTDSYVVSGSALTIKKEFLDVQSIGSHELNIKFDRGDMVSLIVNIIDSTVPSKVSAVIEPSNVVLDKELLGEEDLNISITWNDATIINDIKKNGTSLGNDTYVVSGSALTINKEYLKELPLGNHSLVIVFDEGEAAILMIEVKDSTQPETKSATIQPGTGIFDKYYSKSQDVKTTVTWNDATQITDIKNNGRSIGTDSYTIAGDNLTIRKEYLRTLSRGNQTLNIEFDAGNAAILAINILDTTPNNPTPGNPSSPPQTVTEPQIVGSDNAKGWNAIMNVLSSKEAGSKVVIHMNGKNILPKGVIHSLKGKDITLELQINEYKWIINGMDITEEVLSDINLAVTFNPGVIKEQIIKEIANESKTKQLQLMNNGKFGFKAALEINLDKANSGFVANLFYYDSIAGKLILQDVGKIDENGNVNLSFLHASDYVIIMGKKALLEKVPDKISVTPANKTLYIGGTTGKSASIMIELPEVISKAAEQEISSVKVTYQSSNKKVATVSKTGKITGKGEGTAVIKTSVTIDGVTKSYNTKIRVAKAYIKFTKATSSMRLGETFAFAVKCYGFNQSDVIYSTTARSKVVIGKKSGKAIGKTKGIDYVVATCDTIQKKTKVTVK
ncbi:putative alpha-1,2-mannosidase [Mobilisporobacter senegalensis]|uniref:Putative alpha-1,2-mannosidase n=1 Tax=Mobilisporobacter senegalensis TaxID=1329262 RepID=A0A3N1XPR0_9FIRM|nr:GH92 family glycosyl hydrolase [Mobilisporobacter senegalensis]ROR28669.1 putative alpha-1,2-mannosidase [Mobilisporobacter senegalensis]